MNTCILIVNLATLINQINDVLSHNDAVDISFFKNFKVIQEFVNEHGKAFIFMGEGQHKIKRKAEQIACNEALKFINDNEENDINEEMNDIALVTESFQI